MDTKNRQRGMSLISWIFVIAVAVFLGMVGVKSLPVYLNHYKVVSIMHNVAAQPGAAQFSPNEVKMTFQRRFDVDMVKHLRQDASQIRVVNNPGGARALALDYEVRVHMFYNVDTVYSFKENVPLGP